MTYIDKDSQSVMTDSLQIAEALTTAVAARDIEAVADLYHQDLVVWHSYDNAEQTREENLSSLGAFLLGAKEVRYDEIRRQRTDDGFVQQHILMAELADGPSPAPRPACLVVRVRDGKIHRLDEYIGPRR